MDTTPERRRMRRKHGANGDAWKEKFRQVFYMLIFSKNYRSIFSFFFIINLLAVLFKTF